MTVLVLDLLLLLLLLLLRGFSRLSLNRGLRGIISGEEKEEKGNKERETRDER